MNAMVRTTGAMQQAVSLMRGHRGKSLELGQRHGGNLVHVVVTIRGEPSDEGDAGFRGRAFGVAGVERARVRRRDGIVWLLADAVVLGELAHDGRGIDALA